MDYRVTSADVKKALALKRAKGLMAAKNVTSERAHLNRMLGAARHQSEVAISDDAGGCLSMARFPAFCVF